MAVEASKRSKHSGRFPLAGVGAAVWMLFRVVLTFLAATVAVALGGLAYYAFRQRGFNPASVAVLFRLSPRQLVALGFGAALAVFVLGFVWVLLTRRDTADGFPRKLAALTVLALYVWGGYCAYSVSRNLKRSPQWASIHSLYSWPYVGLSFAEWRNAHPKEPLRKALRQFRGLMGI